MAFFDKLNQVAKNIGDKTNDAIETTKLSSKISAEKSAAAEDMKKIGEHYYNLFAAGGEVAPEVLEFCQSAKAHYDAAAAAQAEIERIKAENEAEKSPAPIAAPAGNACPSCGASNAPKHKVLSELRRKAGSPGSGAGKKMPRLWRSCRSRRKVLFGMWAENGGMSVWDF